jgi:flavin reductase (DIM6/NTAB) family NADH-FMN oxidoreductase RutF
MKQKIGPVALVYPIPIAQIGVVAEERVNYTEVGDVAIAGLRPALLMISLHAKHFTNKTIQKTKVFSVNFPNRNILQQTDYCGIHSGNNVDKSQIFTTFFAGDPLIPLIDECPVNIECKVLEHVSIKQRDIYIAGVLETHIDEMLFTEKENGIALAPLTEFEPILYALDNEYYSLGERIGTGFKEGKELPER